MRRSGGGRSRRGFESGETVEREGGCGGGGSLECGWRNHFRFSGGGVDLSNEKGNLGMGGRKMQNQSEK